jgi:RNA ligase
VASGKLISQVHPTLPLTIYNYSQETQYERDWDSITLACRGLVIDSVTGEVVARPFAKFFNWEEVPTEVPVKADYVYVQEKMDGSLGILFNYKGEWIMATRGSFTSEQAIKGLEIAKRMFNLNSFKKSVTYLCEIIYPENRIVVNYGEEKLVFLGASTPEKEIHWTVAATVFIASGVKPEYIVKTEQYRSFGEDLYSALKKQNLENKEGYVLRFWPGDFRIKIKFEDYVKLHRVLTQCSSYDIWENLKDFDKLPNELLENIPDEFYKWVEALEISIRLNFNTIKTEHEMIVLEAKKKINDKKEFAEYVRNLTVKGVNASILFAIWDGKNPAEQIWKIVKPIYEKPFQR